jgi:disulfide bond formation protein DsbB
MSVDFSRIFRSSVRYPLGLRAYSLFFGVQLIFAIAGWLMTGYLGGEIWRADGTLALENAMTYVTYFMPLAIAGWVVMAFLTPAYIDNSAHFLKGKRKPVSDSFDVSRRRFLPMLGLMVVLGLVFLACFGGIFLLAASASLMPLSEGLALAVAGAVWLLAGSIAAVIIFFMALLSPFIVALEKDKPVAAIKKSWKLVGKNKANTLIFLVIFLVAYVAIAVVGSIPEIAYVTLYSQPAALSAESFLLMLIRTVVNAYLVLFMLSSAACYYLVIKK